MKRLILVMLLVFSTLTACSSKQTKVCTTAYPITYLVNKIGGERVSTCSISEDMVIQRAGIEPGYLDDLNQAMLLIHISGLEPYYDLYLKEIRDSKVNVLDLSLHASVYEFARFTYVYSNQDKAVVESEYYPLKEFDRIDKYAKDPFLWMDPIGMTSMARAIKDWLIEHFPESEIYFTRNFKAVEADLARLDAEYQVLKKAKKNVKIVTMTPSFGNWQMAFGVQVYPVILSKYGALPNRIQLEVIKNKIKEDGVEYIAKEPNMTADMEELFQQLVDELELKPVVLNNLSSLTSENKAGNEDYLKLMYDNLTTLESIGE